MTTAAKGVVAFMVLLSLALSAACGGDNKNPLAPTPVPAPTPAPEPTPPPAPTPTPTTAPDLVVDAPTVNDNSPATGAPFTLSATVRNAGDGESAATTLRFYQSTDGTITTADTEAGTAAVGGLAASATSSESISLTAPSTAGTYYYGACVDAVTDESDTTNNCSVSVQVTVSAPEFAGSWTGDLNVTRLVVPEAWNQIDPELTDCGSLAACGASFPVSVDLTQTGTVVRGSMSTTFNDPPQFTWNVQSGTIGSDGTLRLTFQSTDVELGPLTVTMTPTGWESRIEGTVMTGTVALETISDEVSGTLVNETCLGADRSCNGWQR